MRLFYFADGYSRRLDALIDARQIEVGTKGWACNSRWLLGKHDGSSPEKCARDDVQDVRDAAALIVRHGPSTKGGKWVELGLAIAWQKPVCMIVTKGSLDGDATEPPVFAYPAEFTHWAATQAEVIEWLDNLS